MMMIKMMITTDEEENNERKIKTLLNIVRDYTMRYIFIISIFRVLL